MSSQERRYDIDWLRVIAIGLLLIYHTAIGFQPWSLMIGFIQSEESIQPLWMVMAMLNVWRIPLLFFVSGMGVYFAIRKRNWIELILERANRILLPFVFGIFLIVPLHVFIIQAYYDLTISYLPSPGHLWFLGNIFIYVLLLSPVFFYLKKKEQEGIGQKVKQLFKSHWGLLLIVTCFIAEVLLINPVPFELYAMTWHGFYLGFLAFVFGFLCVYSGHQFWQLMSSRRWLFFGIAFLLYLIRVFHFQLAAPDYLVVIESNAWIFTAFGFAYKYFNRPSRLLSSLSKAAYPVYIIHMFVLYLASWLVFPSGIPVAIQFVFVLGITTLGSLCIYEFLIRRVWFLRPFFGLKREESTEVPVEKEPEIKQKPAH